jgi:hypothetical protein
MINITFASPCSEIERTANSATYDGNIPKVFMIPHELKKRKKLANTCNQAIVPPLGTLPALLADSLLDRDWRREVPEVRP